MTIHHPELALSVAHQRHRFATQVAEPFALAVLAEVALSAPHFGKSHAHLGWLQRTHLDLKQIVLAVMIGNPVEMAQVQGEVRNVPNLTLCRSQRFFRVGSSVSEGLQDVHLEDTDHLGDGIGACGDG